MTDDDSVQIAATSPRDGAHSPACDEATSRRGSPGSRRESLTGKTESPGNGAATA